MIRRRSHDSESSDDYLQDPPIEIVEIDYDTDPPSATRRTAHEAGPLRYLVIARQAGRIVDARYTGVHATPLSDEELSSRWQDTDTSRRTKPNGELDVHIPPPVVIVCTRFNPDGVRLVLESLARQTVRRFRIIIVDNSPGDQLLRGVVTAAELSGGIGIQYIVEPRPGLSRARNAALRAVAEVNSVVCWLDDDEAADVRWLEGVLRGFATAPAAWALSGPVLPAELGTPAQRLFEVYGGHSKGKGFTREILTTSKVNPLIPLPPPGVGANMAAYRWVYSVVNYFDESLGAGTAAKGGEDTLFFAKILLLGGTILHEPSAVTYHRHRPTMSQLQDQFRGYGRGLSAFYVALLFWRPMLLVRMVRSLPVAWRALRRNADLRRDDLGLVMPRQILASKRRGFIEGPLHYLRERLRRE